MSHDIEGCWRLLAWIQHYDDGRVKQTFGPTPQGQITYVAGRMSCVMSRPDRVRFTTGGQWNADATEKAGAYDALMAYTGTYEMSLDGNFVTHHVDQSLFPNWIGGAQRRKVEWEGEKLTLTARLEEGTSEARTARLVWERF